MTIPVLTLNKEVVKFSKFPNNESLLDLTNQEIVKLAVIDKTSVDITFRYTGDADLIQLMFLVQYIKDLNKSIKIMVEFKYMPYSRMDRTKNSSPFTLKYVAQFINSLPINKVIVNEMHSTLGEAVLMCDYEIIETPAEYIFLEKTLELLKKLIYTGEFDTDNHVILLPDDGAKKRYAPEIKALGLKYVVGNKTRDFETGRIISLTIEDPEGNAAVGKGQRVLIIDDLTSRGGTFVLSAERLKEAGFGGVDLLVTHAEDSVFYGNLFKHIGTLYCTQSLMNELNDWGNAIYKKNITIMED